MAEYDPNKRREYYLKNRELKGRTSGAGDSSSGGSSSSSGSPTQPKQPSKEEAALITKKKIEQMKARLKKLRETIKGLVAEAKNRSGASDKPDANSSSKSAPDVKLTAKQKADAAKRSKEHYEKNKKTTGSDEVKDLQAQIDKAVERIKKLKKDLDSSTKSQKPKANKK